MHAGLLSLSLVCLFLSLFGFFLVFLFAGTSCGRSLAGNMIVYKQILIEQLPRDNGPKKHPMSLKPQCQISAVHDSQTPSYTTWFPTTKSPKVKHAREKNLRAPLSCFFVAITHHLNVAPYRTDSQCGMCQARKLCETLLLRIDEELHHFYPEVKGEMEILTQLWN